jgi:hypothetical protein
LHRFILHLNQIHLDRVIDKRRGDMSPELINSKSTTIDKERYERIYRVTEIKRSFRTKRLPEVDSQAREYIDTFCASREVIAATPQMLDKALHPLWLIQAFWRLDILSNGKKTQLTHPSSLAGAIAFMGS